MATWVCQQEGKRAVLAFSYTFPSELPAARTCPFIDIWTALTGRILSWNSTFAHELCKNLSHVKMLSGSKSGSP
jgi:hypothetical protein